MPGIFARRRLSSHDQCLAWMRGLLVPTADPQALAAAILRLSGSAVLRGRFADAARRRAERRSRSRNVSLDTARRNGSNARNRKIRFCRTRASSTPVTGSERYSPSSHNSSISGICRPPDAIPLPCSCDERRVLCQCVNAHGRAGAPARAPVVPAHGHGSCRRHLRQPGPLAGRLPAFVDAS
jgi:hypothetical protein